MRFTMLRKYLGLSDGQRSHSRQVFNCGIGWFTNLSNGISIEKGINGLYSGISVAIKDNRTEWRNKLDQLTSGAEYDVIVRRGE